MKIGSIGYATQQGLGILLKDFYDQGLVTDVVTIHHWKHVNHNWYRGPITRLTGINYPLIYSFVDQMDLVVFFETCFGPEVIDYCVEHDKPTILVPMYECTPSYLPEKVTKVINPSLLDQEVYPQGTHIPVPIPDWVTWKKRERARVFVHNAGHGGLQGRNGTAELIQSLQYVKSPIKLIVRSQEPLLVQPRLQDPRMDIRVGTVPREELYGEGDVFIFPEKFNGLSLPLQEAFASGMLVMATNRFPINEWLPVEPLTPVHGYKETNGPGLARTIKSALINPRDIAATIDVWYDKPVEDYSYLGKAYGESNSWNNLHCRYREQLESVLCQSR